MWYIVACMGLRLFYYIMHSLFQNLILFYLNFTLFVFHFVCQHSAQNSQKQLGHLGFSSPKPQSIIFFRVPNTLPNNFLLLSSFSSSLLHARRRTPENRWNIRRALSFTPALHPTCYIFHISLKFPAPNSPVISCTVLKTLSFSGSSAFMLCQGSLWEEWSWSEPVEHFEKESDSCFLQEFHYRNIYYRVSYSNLIYFHNSKYVIIYMAEGRTVRLLATSSRNGAKHHAAFCHE